MITDEPFGAKPYYNMNEIHAVNADTLHHRGWSADVDSLSAHFSFLFCIGLVSVCDIMIKRHLFVTLVVSTGQTHNFGNLRPAIP